MLWPAWPCQAATPTQSQNRRASFVLCSFPSMHMPCTTTRLTTIIKTHNFFSLVSKHSLVYHIRISPIFLGFPRRRIADFFNFSRWIFSLSDGVKNSDNMAPALLPDPARTSRRSPAKKIRPLEKN
jgi:hypothetical protein